VYVHLIKKNLFAKTIHFVFCHDIGPFVINLKEIILCF